MLSKSTFAGIRAGLTRHLQGPPFKRKFTIMNAPAFTSSNRMFLSVLKRIKHDGKDQASHYPSISGNDLKKVLSPEAPMYNLTLPGEGVRTFGT